MWSRHGNKSGKRPQVRILFVIVLCFAILVGLVSCGEKTKETDPSGDSGSETIQAPTIEGPEDESVKQQPDDPPTKRITEFLYACKDMQIPQNHYQIRADNNGELFAKGYVHDADIDHDIKCYVPLADEKYLELEELVEKYRLAEWKGFEDYGDKDISEISANDTAFMLSIGWSDDSGLYAHGIGNEYPENFKEASEAICAFFQPLFEGKKAGGTLYKADLEISGESSDFSFVVPTGYSLGSATFMNKSNVVVRVLDGNGDIVCRVYAVSSDFRDSWTGEESPPRGTTQWGEDVWVYDFLYSKGTTPNATVYALSVMDTTVWIECLKGNDIVAEKIIETLEF